MRIRQILNLAQTTAQLHRATRHIEIYHSKRRHSSEKRNEEPIVNIERHLWKTRSFIILSRCMKFVVGSICVSSTLSIQLSFVNLPLEIRNSTLNESCE